MNPPNRVLTESWIRTRLNLKSNQLGSVKSLLLPGAHHEKISRLGVSLLGFARLRHLDLSCNKIASLDGLDHLKHLSKLNLYFNVIPDLEEVFKLRFNRSLTELDLRLNAAATSSSYYRAFVVHMLPKLEWLDNTSVTNSDRVAAIMQFTTDQGEQIRNTTRHSNGRTCALTEEPWEKPETVENMHERAVTRAKADFAPVDRLSGSQRRTKVAFVATTKKKQRSPSIRTRSGETLSHAQLTAPPRLNVSSQGESLSEAVQRLIPVIAEHFKDNDCLNLQFRDKATGVLEEVLFKPLQRARRESEKQLKRELENERQYRKKLEMEVVELKARLRRSAKMS